MMDFWKNWYLGSSKMDETDAFFMVIGGIIAMIILGLVIKLLGWTLVVIASLIWCGLVYITYRDRQSSNRS